MLSQTKVTKSRSLSPGLLFVLSLPLILSYQNCASSGLVASTPGPHNICDSAFQNCMATNHEKPPKTPEALCGTPQTITQLGALGRVSCGDSCQYDAVNKIHLVAWKSDARGELLDKKGRRADGSESNESEYFRCVAATCDASHTDENGGRCVVRWVAHHNSDPYNKGRAAKGDRCMKDESGRFMTPFNMDPTATPFRFAEIGEQQQDFFCYKSADAMCSVGKLDRDAACPKWAGGSVPQYLPAAVEGYPGYICRHKSVTFQDGRSPAQLTYGCGTL